jgi:O-antigen ligase
VEYLSFELAARRIGLGPVFVFALFAFICIGALFRPHIGLIGYFGWAILRPEFLWRWALPEDLGLQKYIVVATVVGWALHQFPGNRIAGKQLIAVICLVIYLVLSYLSAFGTHDPVRTAIFMSVIWKIVLMAILAVKLLDSAPKIIATMWAIVIAQGFNALEINAQYFRDGYSWAYNYGWASYDSNTYSILTVAVMPMSAVLAIFSKRTMLKLFAALIFILQLHEVFLLESRGSVVGMALMFGLLWSFLPKTAVVNLTFICFIFAGVLLAGPPVVREISSIFAEQEERDSSANSRFDLWRAGLDITLSYPLLGVGPWGAETLVPQHYPGGSDEPRKALHNLFFEVSTGSGVPATIGYIAYFFIPWISLTGLLRRARDYLPVGEKAIATAVVSSIPAYWASSMFSSGAMMEIGYIVAAFGIALHCIHSAKARAVEEANVQTVATVG